MSERRIGLVVPSTNTVMERDAWRLAPDGVVVATARMHYDRSLAPLERLEAQLGHVAAAVDDVRTAAVDVVVYGCTSGSFFRGRRWEVGHLADLEAIAACPVVLTARAVVDAAIALGLRRVTVLTPYAADVDERLHAYLTDFGFTVVAFVRPEREAGSRPADIRPSAIVDALRTTTPEATDGYLLVCTALPVLDLIEPLEAELGRPVVTSNQAAMWAALRSIGHDQPVAGHGRLLADRLRVDRSPGVVDPAIRAGTAR